jgi:hypothetical protein
MTDKTDNYWAAQGVFRIIDNGRTPNPAELEAGKIYALLAVADELRDLNAQLASLTGRLGGPHGANFLRVFDEAPR